MALLCWFTCWDEVMKCRRKIEGFFCRQVGLNNMRKAVAELKRQERCRERCILNREVVNE